MKTFTKCKNSFAIVLGVAVLVGSLAFFIADTTPTISTTESVIETTVENENGVEEQQERQPDVVVHSGVVGRGDTASSLLTPWLPASEIYAMARACKTEYALTRLRRGKPYRILTEDGKFLCFQYEIDTEQYLDVRRDNISFCASRKPIIYQTKMVKVDGTIHSSLYGAVAASGESPALAVRLADMFGWEVDFLRDIREGDRFSVLVEKRYREGKWKGYGDILAASFTNQGEQFTGYLFANKNEAREYYTEDGKSLRRAFLKAPLAFSRISSNYSPRRFHPILKKYKPHYGVDYAAPTGTPISAVGDGVIIAVSRTKAAGKYIKIRHRNNYESVYLHMSRYARGMKRGRKVTQGQVIGYVGSTGYATGPHLDFRMKKNGSYVNPRKATNPRALPVPADKMVEFAQSIQMYKEQLSPSLALGTKDVPNSAINKDS